MKKFIISVFASIGLYTVVRMGLEKYKSYPTPTPPEKPKKN